MEFELLHGDCLDLMSQIPSGGEDLVILDPPYGIGYKTGRISDKANRFTKEIPNDKDLHVLREIAPDLARALKPDSAIFTFSHYTKQDETVAILEKNGLTVKNRIIWDKGNHTAGDLRHTCGRQYEVILFAAKGKPAIRGKRYSDIWRINRVPQQGQLHQNQKPVALIERMIEMMSDPGDTILDPCMGSGSTGIACLHTGRGFIGIELDDHYFDVAKNRIEAEKARMEAEEKQDGK